MNYTPMTPSPQMPRKHRVRNALLGGGAAIFAIGVIATIASPEDEAESATPDTTVVAEAPEATEAPVTTEAPVALTLADFTISLVTLESQCFDSAGALVTVEPSVAIAGGEYDGQATLVYEIHGGENVETLRIELDGTEYSYSEHTVSTASCDFNLTAVPVNLIER